MHPTTEPGYAHTQKAPLCLFLYGLAALLLLGAWFVQEHQVAFLAMAVGGSATAVITPAFHHLTVEDEGASLSVHFGPLPLPMFRLTIPYADIQEVEVGQTLRSEGLGIHRSSRGGWVWNIWGRDCVIVHRHDGVLRIGSDDADSLARFVEGKIGQRRA